MHSCYSNYKQVKSVIKCLDCKYVESCIRETREKLRVKALKNRARVFPFCNCCMQYTSAETLSYIGEQIITRKLEPNTSLHLYNHACGTTVASKIKLNLE